jgi:peptide/nickel transport system permease protein
VLKFLVHRLLHVVPTLIIVSVISFFIIQLPPGDFLTTQVANLEARARASTPRNSKH